MPHPSFIAWQADVLRVKHQLLADGVELEEFGGTVQVVETAATAGVGLAELEEAILLQVADTSQLLHKG